MDHAKDMKTELFSLDWEVSNMSQSPEQAPFPPVFEYRILYDP